MSRLLREYQAGRFLVLVSPPGNQLELFQAAFEAGIDAAKVHLNVEHRASGRHFGSWSEEQASVREILASAPVPLGVMPGAEVLPEESEMREMASWGLDFLDIYARHMPPWMWDLTMTRMVALGHGEGPEKLPELEARGMDVLEASVVDPKDYGQPLEESDLEIYRTLASATTRPLLVPSQKALVPSDLIRLKKAGVQSVLLGVLAIGGSPESFQQRLPAFVEAARKLG